MTELKNNLEQLFKQVSAYKFTSVERQKQYKELLVGLESLISNNDFDEIWDDTGLMETFTQKLEAILDLLHAETMEQERVWLKDECIEWAKEAGIKDPEDYIDYSFRFVDGHIEVIGDIDVSGRSVTELPRGITWISGFVSLYESQVRSLPVSLEKIGENLFLDGCDLDYMPDSLEIGGDVYVTGNSPEFIAVLNKMKEKGQIKGDIITE